MTTVFGAAGGGSGKACWVLMRRARADRFESASSAAIPSSFQRVAFRRPEKPDMYWAALRAAERALISVVEIGYVRRSEIKTECDLIGDRRIVPVPACPLLENQTDRVLQNKGATKVEEGERAVCSSGELLGEILSQNGVAENRSGPHSRHDRPRQIARQGQSKHPTDPPPNNPPPAPS